MASTAIFSVMPAGPKEDLRQALLASRADFDHVAALVGAAMRADPMRKLVLLAVGAPGEGRSFEVVVSPALVATGSRMTTLRVGHDDPRIGFYRPESYRF